MGHHLVAVFGARSRSPPPAFGSDQLGQRLGDGRRRIVGEQLMLDLPAADPCSDRHGFDLADGRGQGERLQRGVGDHTAFVFDIDEDPADIRPSCSKRSTTAGAASGPLPRMVVFDFCSGGV